MYDRYEAVGTLSSYGTCTYMCLDLTQSAVEQGCDRNFLSSSRRQGKPGLTGISLC